MLKHTLTKFLVINGVQAAIIIEENGEIIESIKSGIVIDKNNLNSIISTLMVESKATAAHFGSAPLSMVFVENSDNFCSVENLNDEKL